MRRLPGARARRPRAVLAAAVLALGATAGCAPQRPQMLVAVPVATTGFVIMPMGAMPAGAMPMLATPAAAPAAAPAMAPISVLYPSTVTPR